MMKNAIVREELDTRRIKHWELARRLGISDNTLSRKLREELPQEEQEKLVQIIQQMAEGEQDADIM